MGTSTISMAIFNSKLLNDILKNCKVNTYPKVPWIVVPVEMFNFGISTIFRQTQNNCHIYIHTPFYIPILLPLYLHLLISSWLDITSCSHKITMISPYFLAKSTPGRTFRMAKEWKPPHPAQVAEGTWIFGNVWNAIQPRLHGSKTYMYTYVYICTYVYIMCMCVCMYVCMYLSIYL